MYWYHGSKKLFPKLKKHKAYAPPGAPPEDGLEAIYLTPDFVFALFNAAIPPGTTKADLMNRTMCFENPDMFNPEEEIYIYIIDPSKVPDDRKKYIDEWQIVVDMDEIEPDKVETYKSAEILKYFTIEDEILKV